MCLRIKHLRLKRTKKKKNVVKRILERILERARTKNINTKPITLAQLKAENNSEKRKNEIRQLLYYLYRSRKLTKQLYKMNK